MKNTNPVITVFEHQRLSVGDAPNGVPFGPAQWNSLIRLHATLPRPYYTLTHRGVRLSHYVGVLKTPQLTLEILPKADARSDASAPAWRQVLVDMLAECQYLRAYRSQVPITSSRAEHLLDYFLLDFLAEVETLCRRGLVKQYQRTDTNASALKGQLLFAQQVRHNLAHQERFFVRHHTYTRQHALHRLLKLALQLVPRLSQHPVVQAQSQRLLHYFADVRLTSDTVPPLPTVYSRQTAAYRPAATIAYQLLSADFSHLYPGRSQSGFALLLDMNLLFEEFVYHRLQRLARPAGLSVRRQTSRPLWGRTQVRPDLVVEFPDERESLVIDTKWKVLTRPRPSAEDLQQLYVYNQLFEARRGILLYPHVHDLPAQRHRFDGPGRSYAEVNFVKIANEHAPGLHPQLDKSLRQLLQSPPEEVGT